MKFIIVILFFTLYPLSCIKAQPIVGAPTPTVASTNVISVFSGAYANASGTDFNPNWGQSTEVTQLDIAGNKTLKYTNLNYQGTQFASGLNVTGMTLLHVDFWTANSTALSVYIISPGPVEKAYALPITQNEWVSVDIPLSFFTNPTVDLSNVIQFKFEGNGTVYLDNLYFSTTSAGVAKNYTLVWSDEFSGTGAPAADHWFRQTQFPIPGSWFGGEEQHYTDRLENSYVADGFLNIVAKKENYTDQGFTKNYTSTRLNSKYAFTYGRVDVRAKIASGAGTLPAIWMLGKNISETGAYFASEFGTTVWPATGEIDIMEHWGSNPNVIHTSVHTPSSFGGTVNTNTTTVSQVTSTFHVYSLIWDVNQLQFLVDDVPTYTYNPAIKNASTWPFDKPQYLLLNIALGGAIGTVDPTFTESTMMVDYIRIYQEGVSSQQITFPSIEDKLAGGPAFALAATATSGLPVTYKTSSNNITLSGNQVNLVSAGRATITADQLGNESFAAAAIVERSFCINPVKPIITISNPNTKPITLTSSAATGNQWFFNGNMMANETSSTLITSEAGVYTVQVKVDDCESDMSEETVLVITGEEYATAEPVTVFPNPADDYVEIAGLQYKKVQAQVSDLTGKTSGIVFEQNENGFRANLQQLPKGIYLINIAADGKRYHLKLIKK
jgi:beta-glucanase (GH16 family)